MFRAKLKSSQGLQQEIQAVLNTPDWLQSVTIRADGRVLLVIQADPDDLPKYEALRLEAESTVRALKGVKEVESVLTSDRPAGASSPPPSRVSLTPAPPAGQRRVKKGARLSDEALRQGSVSEASSAIDPIPGISRILVVASAKGGVAKSTVAVNLAAALSRVGLKVGLLDADIYGPSIPTMLGTQEAEPGTLPSKKLAPVEAHGMTSLSIGYLSDPDAPMIWRGPIVMSAINQLLRDAEWGTPKDPLDILIIDTPPGTGDAQLAIAQRVPVTAALIVTTPQEVALADVRRGAAMFAKTHVPVLGIVETMSWFEDTGGKRHYLMGEGGGVRMAEQLGMPLLAQIPMLEDIRKGGDTGQPAALGKGPSATIFAELARTTALAVDALQTKPAPEIVFED